MKIFVFLIVLATIILHACQKEMMTHQDNKDPQVALISAQEFNLLKDRLNEYRPKKDEIGTIYHQFTQSIKSISAFGSTQLKGDPDYPDSPIDKGMWLIETALNNEYGFKNDSIAYEKDRQRSYALEIIDYDSLGTPVVSGQKLDAIYLDMETVVLQGNQVDSNFWMCLVNLDRITIDSVHIVIQAFRGKIYGLWSVLPPGNDPVPFPIGTSLKSCNWNNGIPPLFEAIEWRIRGGTFLIPAPGYIFVYAGHSSKSFYTMLSFPPDNRFWGGSSPNESINTERCNQYLFSQKEVVDENNPYPNYLDIVLGTLDINYFESPYWYYNCKFWHTSDFYYFELVYVGLPE